MPHYAIDVKLAITLHAKYKNWRVVGIALAKLQKRPTVYKVQSIYNALRRYKERS